MTAGSGSFYDFADLEADSPFPGVDRRAFDSDQATVTSYTFDAGAEFPMHRHPQEQITLVEEGTVTFLVEGEKVPMRAGQSFVVGPNVEHSLIAGAAGATILAVVIPKRAAKGAYTVLDS